MTATDDRLALQELRMFARECDDAADRLADPEPPPRAGGPKRAS